jgi:glycosyltransferase involved in cell wall biosynthesis
MPDLLNYLFILNRKENTVLRARVHCSRVSVIPNAVDTAAFTPDPSKRSTDSSEYLSYVGRIEKHEQPLFACSMGTVDERE